MLFNTIEYIFVFLPIAILGYFLLNHQHLVLAAKWWLVGSSIIFYAWWNLNNLPILLVSMLANWTIVNAIWRANERSDLSRAE
jgi:alginate O-acetyltransferase complex protein AlgI